MITRACVALLWALGVLLAPSAFAAAVVTIINSDQPNVGFNDPTAAIPVGGNNGTTLGAQRLIAMQAAANKWAATITSTVPIRIQAQWDVLTCDEDSGLLGSTRPTEVFESFAGAPKHGFWYVKSLADALSGVDQDPMSADITTTFNSNLGQTGCLTGTFFYLGLDNQHGTDIDLVGVATHEFAHGLGFATTTNASTGVECCGSNLLPSIFDNFLLDISTGKSWTAMSNAERAASAVDPQKLVWTGANVVAAVPDVLQPGTPFLTVTSPAAAAGRYVVGEASFGAPLSSPGVTGQIAQVVDSPGNIGLACTALSAGNAAAVRGRIALVDRGTCNFVDKADNAQAAGAIAVVIVDNVEEWPPVTPQAPAPDPTLTIPVVSITLDDGTKLKAALATLPPDGPGALATVGTDLTVRAGADPSNRPFMYTPNPYLAGSSVSHWDTYAFPNQLMEPYYNSDLTRQVTPPIDLTAPLLADIGWNYASSTGVNYEGLWWGFPAGSESGWGINLAHQGNVIFATWFTYDSTGKGWWLSMTAPLTGPRVYSGTLYATAGPAFNAAPFDPARVTRTSVGQGTLTFDDANDASFAYTVNGVSQTKAITHQVFGPLPTCATATGSLAGATNYQDLWWAAPAGSESGWGINLTQQGATIFATWFTYDLDGTPMWLSVTAASTVPGAYSGALYRTMGPPFNAVPFNPASVTRMPAGTASFIFADGNSATFAYTVNGVSQTKTITRQVFTGPGTVCH